MLKRFLYGVLGNLVKDHPLHVFALELSALFQLVLDVPRDGFSLAIGVGCENELIVVLQRFFYIFQTLIAVGLHQPRHFKIIVRVNRSIFCGQVPDVSEACENFEILAQILIDGFCLGWGLNDNNGHVFFPALTT